MPNSKNQGMSPIFGEEFMNFIKNSPLQLLFCGYSRVKKGDYRHLTMTTHTFWQADLCIEGSAEIVFHKYTLRVKQNDILIIPPGVYHKFNYISPTEKFCCYSFKFSLENWVPEKKYIAKLISGTQHESIREKSLECISKIFHEIFPKKYWHQSLAFATSNLWPGISLLENMLYGIILNFYFDDQENTTATSRLIRKLREYIILRNGAPVTLSELAAQFGYTPNYLSTLILNETGKRAKYFIDHERVSVAKHFLRYSNLRINEIADIMGFNDINYFRKFYKRITGVPPSKELRF